MDINRVKTKLSYIPEGKRPTEYIEGMGLGLKELLKNGIGIEEIAELYEQVIRSRSQEIDNVTGRVDYVVEFMNYFQEQLQLLEYECQEIKLTPDSKRKFNAINKMYRDVKLFQGMIEVFGDDCEAAVEDNGISYSDIRVDELINGENDDNFERLVVKPRDIVRNGYESKWIQCEEFTPKMRQLLEVLEEYVNEEKSKEDESIKAKGMTKEKYEKYIAGLFETFGMEIISVMNVTLEKNKSRNETRKRESDKDVKIPWEMVFCAIVMLDSKDISINELESIVLKGIGEEGKDKEKRVLEKGQEKECVIEKLCEFVGEMEKKGIKEFYEQYKMIREFVELQGGKENAVKALKKLFAEYDILKRRGIKTKSGVKDLVEFRGDVENIKIMLRKMIVQDNSVDLWGGDQKETTEMLEEVYDDVMELSSGLFSVLSEKYIKNEFFKYVLVNYELVVTKEICRRAKLGDGEYKEAVLHAGRELSDNSGTGDMKSMDNQKAVEILKLVDSEETREQIRFLEGVNLLWTVNANIEPMVVRNSKIEQVIDQVLRENKKGYRKIGVLREAGRLLGMYKTETETKAKNVTRKEKGIYSNTEMMVIRKVLESAIDNGDYKFGYDVVKTVMGGRNSVDEAMCREIVRLTEELEAKEAEELLGYVIRVCDSELLLEMSDKWRQLKRSYQYMSKINKVFETSNDPIELLSEPIPKMVKRTQKTNQVKEEVRNVQDLDMNVDKNLDTKMDVGTSMDMDVQSTRGIEKDEINKQTKALRVGKETEQAEEEEEEVGIKWEPIDMHTSDGVVLKRILQEIKGNTSEYLVEWIKYRFLNGKLTVSGSKQDSNQALITRKIKELGEEQKKIFDKQVDIEFGDFLKSTTDKRETKVPEISVEEIVKLDNFLVTEAQSANKEYKERLELGKLLMKVKPQLAHESIARTMAAVYRFVTVRKSGQEGGTDEVEAEKLKRFRAIGLSETQLKQLVKEIKSYSSSEIRDYDELLVYSMVNKMETEGSLKSRVGNILNEYIATIQILKPDTEKIKKVAERVLINSNNEFADNITGKQRVTMMYTTESIAGQKGMFADEIELICKIEELAEIREPFGFTKIKNVELHQSRLLRNLRNVEATIRDLFIQEISEIDGENNQVMYLAVQQVVKFEKYYSGGKIDVLELINQRINSHLENPNKVGSGTRKVVLESLIDLTSYYHMFGDESDNIDDYIGYLRPKMAQLIKQSGEGDLWIYTVCNNPRLIEEFTTSEEIKDISIMMFRNARTGTARENIKRINSTLKMVDWLLESIPQYSQVFVDEIMEIIALNLQPNIQTVGGCNLGEPGDFPVVYQTINKYHLLLKDKLDAFEIQQSEVQEKINTGISSLGMNKVLLNIVLFNNYVTQAKISDIQSFRYQFYLYLCEMLKRSISPEYRFIINLVLLTTISHELNTTGTLKLIIDDIEKERVEQEIISCYLESFFTTSEYYNKQANDGSILLLSLDDVNDENAPPATGEMDMAWVWKHKSIAEIIDNLYLSKSDLVLNGINILNVLSFGKNDSSYADFKLGFLFKKMILILKTKYKIQTDYILTKWKSEIHSINDPLSIKPEHSTHINNSGGGNPERVGMLGNVISILNDLDQTYISTSNNFGALFSYNQDLDNNSSSISSNDNENENENDNESENESENESKDYNLDALNSKINELDLDLAQTEGWGDLELDLDLKPHDITDNPIISSTSTSTNTDKDTNKATSTSTNSFGDSNGDSDSDIDKSKNQESHNLASEKKHTNNDPFPEVDTNEGWGDLDISF